MYSDVFVSPDSECLSVVDVDRVSRVLESWETALRSMHWSFVNTAPPPTGKGEDYAFSVSSALL